MGIVYEDGKTPKGAPLLIMRSSGKIDLAEAKTLDEHVLPGRPYHLQRSLVYVATGTEYTADARRYFPTLNQHLYAMATIVTSAVVRATINLISRVSGGSRNFKMFTDEASALAWLDEVSRTN